MSHIDTEIFQRRVAIIDTLGDREVASFIIGMSFHSALMSQSEISRGITLAKADEEELTEVKRSLKTLGLSEKLLDIK